MNKLSDRLPWRAPWCLNAVRQDDITQPGKTPLSRTWRPVDRDLRVSTLWTGTTATLPHPRGPLHLLQGSVSAPDHPSLSGSNHALHAPNQPSLSPGGPLAMLWGSSVPSFPLSCLHSAHGPWAALLQPGSLLGLQSCVPKLQPDPSPLFGHLTLNIPNSEVHRLPTLTSKLLLLLSLDPFSLDSASSAEMLRPAARSHSSYPSWTWPAPGLWRPLSLPRPLPPVQIECSYHSIPEPEQQVLRPLLHPAEESSFSGDGGADNSEVRISSGCSFCPWKALRSQGPRVKAQTHQRAPRTLLPHFAPSHRRPSLPSPADPAQPALPAGFLHRTLSLLRLTPVLTVNIQEECRRVRGRALGQSSAVRAQQSRPPFGCVRHPCEGPHLPLLDGGVSTAEVI